MTALRIAGELRGDPSSRLLPSPPIVPQPLAVKAAAQVNAPLPTPIPVPVAHCPAASAYISTIPATSASTSASASASAFTSRKGGLSMQVILCIKSPQ